MVAGGFLASLKQCIIISLHKIIFIGFLVSLISCVLHLIITLGLGTSFSFPVFCLEILDNFSKMRGTASSIQSCIHMILMAITAGIIAPMVNSSPILLTGTSFLMNGLVFLIFFINFGAVLDN